MFKKFLKKSKQEVLFAHVTGQVIALEDVPDPVFNQKMMWEKALQSNQKLAPLSLQ